jgi:hypothetical protein
MPSLNKLMQINGVKNGIAFLINGENKTRNLTITEPTKRPFGLKVNLWQQSALTHQINSM